MKPKLLFIAVAAVLLAGCQTGPLLSQAEINEIQNDAWNPLGPPPPTYYPSAKNDAAIMLWLDARREGPPLTTERLAAMDDMHLCIAYSKHQDDLAALEINRRKLFTPGQWAAVKTRQLNVDMTENEVLASRGFPTTSTPQRPPPVQQRNGAMMRSNRLGLFISTSAVSSRLSKSNPDHIKFRQPTKIIALHEMLKAFHHTDEKETEEQ